MTAIQERTQHGFWTPEQRAALWSACERQTGHFGRIPENLWWMALHAVLWDTGQPVSALLRVPWKNVNLDAGQIVVRIRRRNGMEEDRTCSLQERTVATLKRLRSPKRELVWAFPFHKSALHRKYKKILEAAGLPTDKRAMFRAMLNGVAETTEDGIWRSRDPNARLRMPGSPFFARRGWFANCDGKRYTLAAGTQEECAAYVAAKAANSELILPIPECVRLAAEQLPGLVAKKQKPPVIRAGQRVEQDPDGPLSLLELARRYSEHRLAGCPANTLDKYIFAINYFGDFVGHLATINDLTEPAVLGYSKWLVRAQSQSMDTASGYHARILALWRFACRRGLLQVWPEQQKLKVPRRIPIAWSAEQIATLFKACERQIGQIAGCPANLWWHSLHAVLWDTGERIGAIMKTTWFDIDLDRLEISIPAERRKGRTEDKRWDLHADTVAVLRRLYRPQDSPPISEAPNRLTFFDSLGSSAEGEFDAEPVQPGDWPAVVIQGCFPDDWVVTSSIKRDSQAAILQNFDLTAGLNKLA